MIRRFSFAAAVLTCAAAFLIGRPASAYSVLAHEATVDALWDDEIVPPLRRELDDYLSRGAARAGVFSPKQTARIRKELAAMNGRP